MTYLLRDKKKRRERGKLNRGAKSEPQGFRGKRIRLRGRKSQRDLLHFVAHHLTRRRVDDRLALPEATGVRSASRHRQPCINALQLELAIRPSYQKRGEVLGMREMFFLAFRQQQRDHF